MTSAPAQELDETDHAHCWTGALKQMQYRSGLIDGFLARTGLDLTPFSNLLSALEKACAGRAFTQRRDAAIIAVFPVTGIRLAELATIRYDQKIRSDVDLWQREITVRGKAGKARIVRFGYQAAETLDRYLRVRARHAQA